METYVTLGILATVIAGIIGVLKTCCNRIAQRRALERAIGHKIDWR